MASGKMDIKEIEEMRTFLTDSETHTQNIGKLDNNLQVENVHNTAIQ
jgi:hypothetical protein